MSRGKSKTLTQSRQRRSRLSANLRRRMHPEWQGLASLRRNNCFAQGCPKPRASAWSIQRRSQMQQPGLPVRAGEKASAQGLASAMLVGSATVMRPCCHVRMILMICTRPEALARGLLMGTHCWNDCGMMLAFQSGCSKGRNCDELLPRFDRCQSCRKPSKEILRQAPSVPGTDPPQRRSPKARVKRTSADAAGYCHLQTINANLMAARGGIAWP